MEKLFCNLLRIIFFPLVAILKLCKFFYRKIKNKLSLKNLKNFDINKIDALNGYEFEDFVAMLFSCMGYDSMATQKSVDNGVDVIAKKNRKIIAIQTKLYYNHSVGNKAVQEIYTAKNLMLADYGVVITNSYFTPEAKQCAKKLNILLIDRISLQNILLQNTSLSMMKCGVVLISENKI